MMPTSAIGGFSRFIWPLTAVEWPHYHWPKYLAHSMAGSNSGSGAGTGSGAEQEKTSLQRYCCPPLLLILSRCTLASELLSAYVFKCVFFSYAPGVSQLDWCPRPVHPMTRLGVFCFCACRLNEAQGKRSFNLLWAVS